MSAFMYALRAADTKMQVSIFLKFSGIQGKLEEQANAFVSKARHYIKLEKDFSWSHQEQGRLESSI